MEKSLKKSSALRCLLAAALTVACCFGVFAACGKKDTFSMLFAEPNIHMTVGEQVSPTYKIKKNGAELSAADAGTYEFVWSSQNSAIVSVTEGTLTAVSAGSTTVSMTEKNKKFSAVISVAVEEGAIEKLTVSDFVLVGRDTIEFETTFADCAVFVNDTQYIMTIVGKNTVVMSSQLVYDKPQQFYLKKSGYESFHREFAYEGEKMSSIDMLRRSLGTAESGDYFIVDKDMTLENDVSMTIPKGVTLRIEHTSVLTNNGNIYCLGIIIGDITGNEVSDKENLPEEEA